MYQGWFMSGKNEDNTESQNAYAENTAYGEESQESPVTESTEEYREPENNTADYAESSYDQYGTQEQNYIPQDVQEPADTGETYEAPAEESYTGYEEQPVYANYQENVDETAKTEEPFSISNNNLPGETPEEGYPVLDEEDIPGRKEIVNMEATTGFNGNENMEPCIIGPDMVIEGDVYSTRPIILQGVVTGAIRTTSTVAFAGGMVQKNVITLPEDAVMKAEEQIKARVTGIQLAALQKELDDRDAEVNFKNAEKKA